MSELLDGGGLAALGRTGYLHGENESDAAAVILVLARAGGIEDVGVLGDQEFFGGAGERGGFASGEAEHLAGVLGDTLGVLLAVPIADLRVPGHDDAG